MPWPKGSPAPEHMRRRQSALSRGAELRPAGSINTAIYAASRHVRDRLILERERRMQEGLEGQPTVKLGAFWMVLTEQLPDYTARYIAGLRPHLATESVPGTMTYIPILAVDDRTEKGSNRVRNIYVSTPDGEVLVPDYTTVVWRKE